MRIFVSYASEDVAIAEQVALAQAGVGHDVFFDKQSLPPGGDFHTRIKRAIEQSDLFIFLVSPDSVRQGGFALTELKFARQKWPHPKGKVLPVMVRLTAWEEVPNYLKAVTVLEPEGNVAAEVRAAVGTLTAEANLSVRRALRVLAAAGVVVLLYVSFMFVFRDGMTVSNAYHDEIRLMLDSTQTTMQTGESVPLRASRKGTPLYLWSCGWEEQRTDHGQASGCRWIPYTVYSGERWTVVPVKPSPRIVLQRQRSWWELW